MQDLIATIRKAIQRDRRTLYAIAKDAELPYSTVHRFATGERTAINVVTAEKLCRTLRLELRPRKG